MLTAFRPKGIPLSSWRFLLVLGPKFSCLVFINVLSLSSAERFYPAVSVGHCFSHPAWFVSNALCLERVTKFVSSAPPCVCRKWGVCLSLWGSFLPCPHLTVWRLLYSTVVLFERKGEVCVCVCVRHAHSLTVKHRCEPPHVGAGCQTQVLWKSSKCSQPQSHLSCPLLHFCTLNILLSSLDCAGDCVAWSQVAFQWTLVSGGKWVWRQGLR